MRGWRRWGKLTQSFRNVAAPSGRVILLFLQVLSESFHNGGERQKKASSTGHIYSLPMFHRDSRQQNHLVTCSWAQTRPSGALCSPTHFLLSFHLRYIFSFFLRIQPPSFRPSLFGFFGSVDYSVVLCKGTRSPGTKVTESCKQSHGCWELNLEKQPSPLNL